MADPKKIGMKLLIDKTKNKVLFAEAGKDTVDFFLHILSLPLATIVNYLTKTSMVGSIGTLYASLESLSCDYAQDSSLIKDFLLHPKPPSGSPSTLPLLTSNTPPNFPTARKFYTCIKTTCEGVMYGGTISKQVIHKYVSDVAGEWCPECKAQMFEELAFVLTPAAEKKKAVSGGGYVKGVVTYMIMDDLSVQPMSTISGISLLNKFNVKDVSLLEEKDVTLDMKLGLALLKASLMSKTVLTDVFLGNKGIDRN